MRDIISKYLYRVGKVINDGRSKSNNITSQVVIPVIHFFQDLSHDPQAVKCLLYFEAKKPVEKHINSG